ncbi:5-formyltetrahydrofolate cyclo-ligase [Lentibacillus lipolyticus]|nr:5-formyltetrahydrofolate cyclo-ligase [Lentibacillus lipolyticus]
MGVCKLNKQEMRKTAINKLKNIPTMERRQIEQRLQRHLTDSVAWQSADSVGITVSKGFEWDTNPIIETAWQEGKSVCVPKCFPDERKLNFFILNTYDQLETVFHGLLEPKPTETEEVSKKDIDLLIVPGLVFDKHGYRIGFGGGYYDRFLVDFPNRKLSLAASFQVVERLPSDSYDIPVDTLITE